MSEPGKTWTIDFKQQVAEKKEGIFLLIHTENLQLKYNKRP